MIRESFGQKFTRIPRAEVEALDLKDESARYIARLKKNRANRSANYRAPENSKGKYPPNYNFSRREISDMRARIESRRKPYQAPPLGLDHAGDGLYEIVHRKSQARPIPVALGKKDADDLLRRLLAADLDWQAAGGKFKEETISAATKILGPGPW